MISSIFSKFLISTISPYYFSNIKSNSSVSYISLIDIIFFNFLNALVNDLILSFYQPGIPNIAFPKMYNMDIKIITMIIRTIKWPGLNLILLWYSSKYLTNPPMPEGILILSWAIVSVRISLNIKKLLIKEVVGGV